MYQNIISNEKVFNGLIKILRGKNEIFPKEEYYDRKVLESDVIGG